MTTQLLDDIQQVRKALQDAIRTNGFLKGQLEKSDEALNEAKSNNTNDRKRARLGIAELKQEIDSLKAKIKPRWIPVANKPEPIEVLVWVITHGSNWIRQDFGTYIHDEWVLRDGLLPIGDEVLYWQPMMSDPVDQA